MSVRAGREFLAIPGPTTIPDEVLRAMHRPAVDIYSGPLLALTDGLMRDVARVFKNQRPRLHLYRQWPRRLGGRSHQCSLEGGHLRREMWGYPGPRHRRALRQGVPHRPYGARQRADGLRHTKRYRDGVGGAAHSAR
jgi:hypothetical protein